MQQLKAMQCYSFFFFFYSYHPLFLVFSFACFFLLFLPSFLSFFLHLVLLYYFTFSIITFFFTSCRYKVAICFSLQSSLFGHLKNIALNIPLMKHKLPVCYDLMPVLFTFSLTHNSHITQPSACQKTRNLLLLFHCTHVSYCLQVSAHVLPSVSINHNCPTNLYVIHSSIIIAGQVFLSYFPGVAGDDHC